MQIGNYMSQPSNTGVNWKPTGKTVYNIQIDEQHPCIPVFGIDTEGGDRAKTNLLRKPIELIIHLADGAVVTSSGESCEPVVQGNTVTYCFSPYQSQVEITWSIEIKNEQILMKVATKSHIFQMTHSSGRVHPRARCRVIEQILLLIPFSARAMGTNIISENWGEKGQVHTPLIINALDMGQLSLNSGAGDTSLNCIFTGSRTMKYIDFTVEVATNDDDGAETKCDLVFSPVHLEKPGEHISQEEWMRVRRGLLSLLQCTPYYPQANALNGSPGGIIGNNVLSEPVSCEMRHNFRWVAGMGDKSVVAGVNLNSIVKYTIEHWLQNRVNEDGSVDIVLEYGNIGSDSNTGVLNAAGDYFNSTCDVDFVRRNAERIKRVVNYFITRDFCDDGLFISHRDGNGNRKFNGDTCLDTIGSGYKNAWSNAQAYKAFLDVAAMMEAIGDHEQADFYRLRAKKLRVSYNRQFYDADTGLYYWWIGKNGIRHQYINPTLQAMAVTYGLADHLYEDAGVNKTGKDIMTALWNEFDRAGYHDSKKGVYIKYIDLEKNDYTGFYWGIPINLLPVPPDYNFSDYGDKEFPYYCNGCASPGFTTHIIDAFQYVGMEREADLIKKQIYRRQHEGLFENGSGFYVGVAGEFGAGYSIVKWDGTSSDHEGILSRDCSFLENTLWQDPDRYEALIRTTKLHKPD